MDPLQTHLSGIAARGHEWGVGSCVTSLRRVLVRTPTVQGDFEGAQWRKPDPARLLAEHAQFVQLLRDLGCQVEVCAAEPNLVDAVYTHDPVIMTPFGAILLQMHKPVRGPEPEQVAHDLDRLGVPILGSLTGGEFADGGDKVWFDDHTLAMGHGYRTNAAGVERVRRLLESHDVEVVAFDLPHFEGPDAVLHLMSVVSPVADDLAAVYEPLAPVRLLQFLDSRGYERVRVSAAEFATQGANILAVRPRVLVIAEGNPQVVSALRARGCEVHEFAGSELSVKGDGGPTCLTQPLWRAS
ncbi:dimethylarginine dimethylaminohydrolase family protein [Leekyejoonella antrihumi]|uniref:Amidinotransferase n=1 Tax=Leekyejoonella antrihumi TaxID=1660198 RepID=A0A563E0Q2_9MICO|nr:arginine deiminase family protein [Leekyejoonella antrihumi]TWP35781.1 hypothetical protein FGL98_12235 [Leekyejoonella antrihumi]